MGSGDGIDWDGIWVDWVGLRGVYSGIPEWMTGARGLYIFE